MNVYGYTGSRDIVGREYLITPLTAELSADCYVTGACAGLDTFVGMALARRYPNAQHLIIVPASHAMVTYWWMTTEFAGRVAAGNIVVQQMRPGTSYRARNAAIVRVATELFAFPQYPEHDWRSLRSGSWQTVRLARRKGIPIATKILSALPV